MLVELTETSANNWQWEDDSGLQWGILLNVGAKPVEAKPVEGNGGKGGKKPIKDIIKLKEAGFDADEILTLLEAL